MTYRKNTKGTKRGGSAYAGKQKRKENRTIKQFDPRINQKSIYHN